jgi:hypothetical protein
MPESLLQLWTSFLQSQDITAWISQIYYLGRGKTLLAYEFIWLLVVWTFLQWRLGRLSSFWTKLLNQAILALVFWLGALWLIPSAVWGDPYRNLMAFTLKSIAKMLLA